MYCTSMLLIFSSLLWSFWARSFLISDTGWRTNLSKVVNKLNLETHEATREKGDSQWHLKAMRHSSDGGDKTKAKYSTQSLFITEEDVKSPSETKHWVWQLIGHCIQNHLLWCSKCCLSVKIMLKWKEFPVFTISIYLRMKMETAAFLTLLRAVRSNTNTVNLFDFV